MKHIMARYSQVDPIYYSTVLGGGQANAGQLESAIKKSVDTITSNWIITPSWLQAFVEGETCWSDYQVIINNLHRMSKLLKLIPEGETPENRALRLTRREAYKKALRAHQEHVRMGLADLVSQYILEPLKATAVCQSSSTKSLVRSSVDFPDNKALAYAEFKRADSILYPPQNANASGSHMILWVQGALSKKMRTRKRARESDGDEEEGRGMADFLRDGE
ncbi:uncharacterized protein J4E79_007647 [Alternaria viburni]|uniref:uncharacterized protein n=1 Tax=Alternaria viburni TaxID=566460 RepID=UPI0020C32E3F|nr:uncharacterized protein J4E79_007647 [Alternaria viburni]KAI4657032.1 hypothetical protein J4E79_007647 [Alternaria viburni]